MSGRADALIKRGLLARAPFVVAVVALVAIVAAGCGGPATPALSDPKAILRAGIAGLEAGKTFHVDGTATGKFVLSLGGSAGTGSGAPIALDGSTISGDADLPGKRATLSVAIPALLNVKADVIGVDGVVYTHVPLLGSGGWTRQPVAGSVFAGLADPATLLEGLPAALDRPGFTPRTLSNERCDDADCYAVAFTIPAAEVAGGASPAAALPGGLVLGDISVTALVRIDAPRLVKLSFDVPAGAGGTVNVALALSKFGDPVTIEAPPGAE